MNVETLTAIINQIVPEPHSGLLSGILFGSKADISPELLDGLIVTGTLHIIALSGMNITILAALASTLFVSVFSRRIVSLLTIVFIIGFIWFVGPTPSIVRAGIMGIISYTAIYIGRPYVPFLSWILCVVVMVFIDSRLLFDISFQLSAMATLGIIFFGSKKETLIVYQKTVVSVHRLRRVVQFLYRLIENDLRITLAAQVFTVPILLFHFHRVSLISPVANVFIVWLIPPLTVIGWIAALLGFVWIPFGSAVGWVAWIFLEYMIWIVLTMSKLPFASVTF